MFCATLTLEKVSVLFINLHSLLIIIALGVAKFSLKWYILRQETTYITKFVLVTPANKSKKRVLC